jgi:hypothetical protein
MNHIKKGQKRVRERERETGKNEGLSIALVYSPTNNNLAKETTKKGQPNAFYRADRTCTQYAFVPFPPDEWVNGVDVSSLASSDPKTACPISPMTVSVSPYFTVLLLSPHLLLCHHPHTHTSHPSAITKNSNSTFKTTHSLLLLLLPWKH